MRILVRGLVLELAGAALVLGLAPPVAAVTIDWVTVGNPGNAADESAIDRDVGAVAYVYRIAKYEVTNSQYAEFLNAVAATDTNGLYNANMGSGFGGITQSCSPDCTYSAISGRGQMPVNFVSFWDAIRFANWLHNGQPTGAQDGTTTEDGAYTITAQGILENSIARNAGATIFLPSEDEWYKAAYHNALGRQATDYFEYPAGFDAQTTCSSPTGAANHANCFSQAGDDLTDVGSYTGSASPYGTFDQGGNIAELNEAIIFSVGDFLDRQVRGGDFRGTAFGLASGTFSNTLASAEQSAVGFRVASLGAATFFVDSTVDAVDIAPGDGTCLAIVGQDPGCFPLPCLRFGCTLRAAVQEANAWPGADTIVVPPGTYVLTRPGAGENAAATGDLDVTEEATIVGAGADATIVDGNGLDRVFDLAEPGVATGWLITLSELTIRNGVSPAFEDGGGIRTLGFGRVRIEDCVVAGNVSGSRGGGISAAPPVDVVRTTVRDNASAREGGGIAEVGSTGGLLLDRSTVSGNTAGDSLFDACGGLYVENSMWAAHSTVSGNDGGICAWFATVDLDWSTIANNAAFGLHEGGTVDWRLRHTIVSDNPGGDCVGVTVPSGDFNLDSDATCALAGAHDLSGVDPQLGPLAMNGGPTATHALAAASPAVNSGAPGGPNTCFGTDQRGVARPQGPACDRGAYEWRRACGLGAELAGVLGLLAAYRGRSRPRREPG